MFPLLATALLSVGAITVNAQQMQGGCLRLLGSVACPAYSYAYLSPGNLSNAFPFFSTVTDVASFDAAALNYFSSPYQFQTTKFSEEELGCSNASAAVIQYERTVLCSMWVNEQWSIECEALYNSSSAATSQKMVCQNTCLQYSASEYAIVNSTTYCPGPDLTNGARDAQLIKDFTDCTNWTTLATNDSMTCVSGSDNEPNCGFAGSTSQLCAYCSGTSPDDCCYAGTTDMSVCGYVLPTKSVASSSSTSAGSTATAGIGDNAAHSSSTLTGGKLAGTIVGAVIGGLLLLILLLLLLLCCRRKRRNNRNKRDSGSSFAASQAGPTAGAGTGKFGSFFGGGNRNSGGPQNTSEKGLLGQHSAGTASSPTMGGDTLYTPSTNAFSMNSPDMYGKGNGNGGKVMDGLAVPAAGVGAGAAAFGAGAGARSSGIMLPRVKDENQSGNRWIEPGMDVLVLWPYQAALPDELELRQGMRLRILRLYDDAWGTAEVISSSEGNEIGKQGAFPIVCVSEGSSLGHSGSSSATSH